MAAHEGTYPEEDHRQCSENSCIPVAKLFTRTGMMMLAMAGIFAAILVIGSISYTALERATNAQVKLAEINNLTAKIDTLNKLVWQMNGRLVAQGIVNKENGGFE
ncbi:MAG: hypothetical protein WCX88_02720 [Patescibacteria group bacterium]